MPVCASKLIGRSKTTTDRPVDMDDVLCDGHYLHNKIIAEIYTGNDSGTEAGIWKQNRP